MTPSDWDILGCWGITPNKLHFGGNLDLEGTAITALPENLHIGGRIDLRYSCITALPENLHVEGGIDLEGSAITALPDSLHVEGWIDLRDTAITALYVDERGYRLDRAGNRYIAGCRNFTAAEALEHWGSDEYPDKARGKAFCDAVVKEENRRKMGATT